MTDVTLKPHTTALIVVDAQIAFDDHAHWGGNRNNPEAEPVIAALLAWARGSRAGVFHIVHDSVEPDSILKRSLPGGEIKPEALPVEGEPVVVKHVNSAFIGTDLEHDLRRLGYDTLLICGFTTDHCVSTTTRMAGNLGFRVYLIADGCATFDKRAPDGAKIDSETVHRVNLASLDREFCTVASAADIIGSSDKSINDRC